MADNIKQIDDYRDIPHIRVSDDDGNQHIFPISKVLEWINGESIPEPAIFRVIVREWATELMERMNAKNSGK